MQNHSPLHHPQANIVRRYSIRSTSKAKRPQNLNYDPTRLLDPKAFSAGLRQHSPSQPFPLSLLNHNHPSKSNSIAPLPSHPTFARLAADGQQGMKVLFLIDHATKGDAIHHNISAYVHPDSSEMVLLMRKYLRDRSSFQNQIFAKAQAICAQFTSRLVSLEKDGKGSNKSRRLEYLRDKCTDVHLATVYSHLASVVDIPRILAARSPNDKAFKDLMTQVLVHSMEDQWFFEAPPSKQSLSAKMEKENKEEIYSRFRSLTDCINGLPDAKAVPG